MEYKKFGKQYVIRLDPGEEILTELTNVCKKEHIVCAAVQAIGAIGDCVLGLYDIQKKKYMSARYTFPMEITSLLGTVTEKDGETYLHLHMTAADKDQKVYGGHLNSAVISATCEMIVTLIDGDVGRRFDPKIGLNLFQFKG